MYKKYLPQKQYNEGTNYIQNLGSSKKENFTN